MGNSLSFFFLNGERSGQSSENWLSDNAQLRDDNTYWWTVAKGLGQLLSSASDLSEVSV